MTRFDASDPTERRKLFADVIAAHRQRGSQFCTVEAERADDDSFDPTAEDADNDDEAVQPPPWVQLAEDTFNLDCTDAELDRLKSLLDDYPEFRIDQLESPEGAEGTNVRITARSDAARLGGFVERVFREVYDRPEEYRAWVVDV